MKAHRQLAAACGLWLMNASLIASPEAAPNLRWQQLPSLPDPLGFAGAYAGVSGGALLAAGGANFTGKMPWEGGTKSWHNRVFVLETPDGPWKTARELPFECGYGVSVTTAEGVVCIGGSNARGHTKEVFRLSWDGQSVQMKLLPPLPVSLANGCGALVGHSVYVAGGTDAPDAAQTRHTFLQLDLDHLESGWKPLPPWPGRPRMLATAAVVQETFYLVGGADLHPDANGQPVRTYLTDAWAYEPNGGWRRIADLPNPVVAAASPAPVTGNGFLVVSGDDGSHVGFEPKSRHPGFDPRVLHYDVKQNAWTSVGTTPAPRATLPVVEWHNRHIFISGEVRPGVRSPEVWALETR